MLLEGGCGEWRWHVVVGAGSRDRHSVGRRSEKDPILLSDNLNGFV